jgi:hypothetical protein
MQIRRFMLEQVHAGPVIAEATREAMATFIVATADITKINIVDRN